MKVVKRHIRIFQTWIDTRLTKIEDFYEKVKILFLSDLLRNKLLYNDGPEERKFDLERFDTHFLIKSDRGWSIEC